MVLPAVIIFTLLVSLLGYEARPHAAPAQFADNAFQQVWEWTDAPVASGHAQRSWYWGPQPGNATNEPYSGAKSGTRLVQYFDKARMEINNPAGDRKSEWFVTTGLLVAEMVSGKQQVGDKQYKLLRPAEIAVGGDGLETDPDAPTYTAFRGVASLRGPGDNHAANRAGQAVTATLSRAGKVGDNPAFAYYPGAKIAAYSEALGHNIPQAMWDFLNLKGDAQRDGSLVAGQTLANWVYVMGYPITEPYWARIKVAGIYQDVLFQLFERRSLAYLPAMPKGWQVQMGNVGQHYYRWLYGGPLPSPVAVFGTPTPVPPAVPLSIDASIAPAFGPVGTPFGVAISGFRSGEDIVSWFTAPDGKASDARFNLNAGPDGTVKNLSISTLGMSPGQWAVTYHGKGSNHESIAYFLLTGGAPASTRTVTPTRAPGQTQTAIPVTSSQTPATRTPTRTAIVPPRGTPNPSATVPIVPTEPPSGLLMSVRPGYGPPDSQFAFSVRGMRNGEQVQVRFTDPTGSIVYPAGSNNGLYTATDAGTLDFTLQPSQAFPAAPLGTWLWEVHGQQTGREGVIGFTLR